MPTSRDLSWRPHDRFEVRQHLRDEWWMQIAVSIAEEKHSYQLSRPLRISLLRGLNGPTAECRSATLLCLDAFSRTFSGVFSRDPGSGSGSERTEGDDIYGTAPIIKDIWDSSWKAKIMIADVTRKIPNVNYRLGFCHALGVPTILITQNMEDVPFDYKHRRCIPYETQSNDWQASLREKSTRTIQAVLSGAAPADDLNWSYDTELLDI